MLAEETGFGEVFMAGMSIAFAAVGATVFVGILVNGPYLKAKMLKYVKKTGSGGYRYPYPYPFFNFFVFVSVSVMNNKFLWIFFGVRFIE